MLLSPRALALAAALLLGGQAAPAHAGAAPYTDFAFDLKRAADGGNLDAIGELARKDGDFARVWFYGMVFDLVTTGVPDAEKSALRPRLTRIAEALKGAEPPDVLPLLLLDREANGQLEPLAQRARDKQQQMIDLVRSGDPLAARLAAVEDPEAAAAAFYGLFFRAELAGSRLGGEREKALLLDTARAVAEGFALGPGELGPWRTFAKYHGGAAPLNGLPQVEQLLDAGLDARLAGDLPGARAQLEQALQVAIGARGATIFTVMIQNGVANAAHWMGDFPGERMARVRVLQAVRPLQKAFFTALVLEQMVEAHLGDGTLADAIAYTRELRSLGGALSDARSLRTLGRAATAFTQAGTAEAQAGHLETALRYRGEGEAILAAIQAPEAVARYTVAAERTAARLTLRRALADSRVATGDVERRRGRFETARAAYDEARAIYGSELVDGAAATRVLVTLAETRLAEGALDEALAATDEAKAALVAGDALDRARNYGVKGWIRLRRGQPAPAFADANHALTILRDVKDAPASMRGALHRLAALALEAGGYREEALRRLEFAFGVDPSLETARLLAQARVEAGRAAEAAEGLARFEGEGEAARLASVHRGCALTAAGRFDEAITGLATVPGMSLPHLRTAQIVGSTCLTAAYLGKSDPTRARQVLAPARALMLEHADPALAWRVHALDGEIALREGRPAEAAGAWRQAIDFWGDALGDASARGVTLDLRNLAQPLDISSVGRQAPEALLQAADRDRKAADVNRQAALSIALWERRRAAAPASPGLAHASRAPASELGLRAATARAEGLRAVLSDAAVEGTDRVAAGKGFNDAFAERSRLDRDQRVQTPAWDGWLTPMPSPAGALAPRDGEVRLYYAVGDAASHLWLWAAGDAAPASYALPGSAALAGAVKSAVGAVADPPTAWPALQKGRPTDPNEADWDALSAPVETLLPFTKDKKLAAKLTAAPFTRLVVFPDGPLVRLPFAALVLEAPGRREAGKTPVFVASKWAVETRLLADAPAGPRSGQPAKRYAFVGPLPEGTTCAGVGGYQPCGGADAVAEAQAVGAAFEKAAPSFTAFGGAEAGRGAFARALAEHTYVHLGTPVDVSTGDVLVAPAGGGAAPGRITPADLAALPVGADGLLATRPTLGDIEAESGDGLRRLAAAAWHAGLGEIVLAVTRDGSPADAEVAGALAFQVASGAELETALRTLQRDEMAKPVDPKAGGPVRHHPYFWARWIAIRR